MLNLYARNRATHESAVRSLAETGKAAAVVHPTGKRYIYLDNQCNPADELFDGCRLRNTPGRSHRLGHFACPEIYDYGVPLYNQDPTQREKLRTLFAQDREPGA